MSEDVDRRAGDDVVHPRYVTRDHVPLSILGNMTAIQLRFV
jgi:hypothetical protein